MTLIEVLFALLIVVIVAGGMASLYAASLLANNLNGVNVQMLSSARAKVEQIQSIPYEQVGIHAATMTGPGYFVVDPVYKAEYDAANGDALLSDTVTSKNGLQVTRTVTVTAVDDPADGTGIGDFDGSTDPNTGTILDYKLVTVTASATVNKHVLKQTLTTIIRGSLPNEEDAATGKDSDGSDPTKVQKVKTMAPPPPPPAEGCGIPTVPVAKTPGKKGTSQVTTC